jgi:hypothetical protein
VARAEGTPGTPRGARWCQPPFGLRHPDSVKALVPASGYSYPSARVDLAPLPVPAITLVGDVLRYTLAPPKPP